MAVQTLESILREQNPSASQKWDEWEKKLKPKSFSSKGHRGMYGDFVGFIKMGAPEDYAKGVAALDAINKTKDTPAELATDATSVVEKQVTEAEGAIRRRRGRSSTILTGLNGDGGRSPMVKRKSLLGSFSANG